MTAGILMGNTAKRNDSGTWDWTFYLRPANYIEEAVVKLHSSFENPVHKLRGPKLELNCSGWGTFPVKVTITWKGGGQLKTSWELRFDEHQFDFHEELQVPAEVIAHQLLLHGPTLAVESNLDCNANVTPCSEDARGAFLQVLLDTPAIDPGLDLLDMAWHGRLVQQKLPKPKLTWESLQKPREDKHGKQDAPDWLNASEYKDDIQALAHKVKILANLLRCSQKTLAYTGAGLSVAAGIEMAAAGSSKPIKSSPLEANPTIAHCVMAELNRRDLLHGWVQQNHDGLPQKAGYRQEDINEIHGSWYDPSNPVVLYSGSLRSDLFKNMQAWAKEADLVLVLGTSLSGLNADQCVTRTAERSLGGDPGAKTRPRKPSSLGSVIISPQRTPEDGEAALRIFATADEVMLALAQEFNLQVPLDSKHRTMQFSSNLRVKVPYDKSGKRSEKVQTWWDLSPGARLKVSEHNNIEGAQQRAYLGITPNITGEALTVDDRTCCLSIRFPKFRSTMQLGVWWIDAALRGGVEYLPVVNVDAVEMPRH